MLHLNYWINPKIKYIISLIVLLATIGNNAISQEITITSTIYHSIVPIQKRLGIEFVEENNKCGTEGFLTIEEQIDRFREKLKMTGIDFSKFKENKLDLNKSNYKKTKKFYLITDNSKNLDDILKLCHKLYINAYSLKYIYSPHDLSAEDEFIIKAIQQTKSVAEEYAKILNKKAIKIISIDDDTGGLARSSWINTMFLDEGYSKTKDYNYKIKVKYLLE